MISIDKLTHSIGGNVILDKVSLVLPKGKVTALIGPNGAGKSTLLHILARQTKRQQGSIKLDGTEISEIKHQDMALKMAVVAQESGVSSRLTVEDLVTFGRWPHHQGRPTEKDRDAVQQAMSLFDLNELAARYLDEISGGQKQRAFVAMAYAQDTDWLLLDEPLNNLDIHHARSLMRQLRRLADQEGKSIVIVIHDLNYALANADHFVAIKEGKLAFAGPTSQVATSCALSELYQSDIEIIEQGGKRFAYHH
ncbi:MULTISPECIES: ABC transporter ATP-binding protein [unclassified Vibrio]|uniref:ABC transporter ATP-binding protein n=1 Tax=Vibrio sp. HB236076 TaxID=3232307 RepID=A0AB39HHQ1_9VIBR|nr:ATP-binding cassette domain-containing protein [Vibrio sp. HB161653]MDP5255537.1 ATP-binding cassette domain-containing protein [Vibrio sp. HB161653]